MSEVFNNRSVIIETEEGEFTAQLELPINCGGSKCAYKITEDIVLMLPNYRGRSISGRYVGWERVAREELEVSEFLTSVNILNPNHKKVRVTFMENDQPVSFNTYISNNFEGLKKQGIDVIDLKKSSDISYPFYNKDADEKDLTNWHPLLDHLIEDVIILYRYQIPIGGDSLNFAMVRSNNPNLVTPFSLRYFGFDFTNKGMAMNTKFVEQCWNPKRDPFFAFAGSYYTIIDRAVEYLMFSIADFRSGENVFSLEGEYEETYNVVRKYFRNELDKLYMLYADPNCPLPTLKYESDDEEDY